MYNETTGLKPHDRRQANRCPTCGDRIAAIEARGPADRRYRPCGHETAGGQA